MSEQKIEPALTPEQWNTREYTRGPSMVDDPDWKPGSFDAKIEYFRDGPMLIMSERSVDDQCSTNRPDDLRALIALANAALPDDDPRKITREWVRILRAIAERHGGGAEVSSMADALESYLPPETA